MTATTKKAIMQGLVFVIVGAFFLILSTVFYALGTIKIDRLIIFVALSAILVIMGVVIPLLSRNVSQPSKRKKR